MPLARAIWDCHTHIFGPWNTFPLADRPAYVPGEAPFTALQSLHAACGITRGVIVQATPYGDDHRALLAALSASDGAYRGIAVLSDDMSDDSLARMHQHGVRGIRLGMMKHLAGAPDAARMGALLARIKPLGWHALVHAELADVLATVPALLQHGVPLVIDHMGRAPVDRPADWAPLLALLDHPDVWIKLSGADRVTDGGDGYAAALPLMAALLDRAPGRAIWGSDWPHVNIRYASPDMRHLLGLLRRACGEDAALLDAVLHGNPGRIYA
jgi:predicted TIM-barrel fold metal-dependent hydrolase